MPRPGKGPLHPVISGHTHTPVSPPSLPSQQEFLYQHITLFFPLNRSCQEIEDKSQPLPIQVSGVPSKKLGRKEIQISLYRFYLPLFHPHSKISSLTPCALLDVKLCSKVDLTAVTYMQNLPVVSYETSGPRPVRR